MNDGSDTTTTARARYRSAAVRRVLGVVMTALALLVGAAVPASAAELMRITFVRHGQSAGNASGLIDTSTPGPVLTPLGQQQAQTVAGLLGDNNYDGVYASTMVRTQLTAAPMSQYLRLPVRVLAGLQEIEAGAFEGTPESEASSGYGLFPLAWAIQGNRDLRIPGSIDGNEFDARVDGALKTIYDNGDRNAVIFSHGGAIMFWTMMNVQNLTAAQKIDLLRTAPLSNTNYVVIDGNDEDGWTLVNWNGKLFSPEPTLRAEIRRQWRTLNRQLAANNRLFLDSLASRDFATIATAFNRGVADNLFSISKYHKAIQAKVISDLSKVFARPTVEQPAPAATRAAADTVDTAATAGADAGPAETSSRSVALAGRSDSDDASATEEAVTTDDVADAEDVTVEDSDAAGDGSEDVTGDVTEDVTENEADDTEVGTDDDTSADRTTDSDASGDADGGASSGNSDGSAANREAA
jgi:broad specificity phosphatase PhoE